MIEDGLKRQGYDRAYSWRRHQDLRGRVVHRSPLTRALKKPLAVVKLRMSRAPPTALSASALERHKRSASSLPQPAAHSVLVSTIVFAESRFKIALLHWHNDVIQQPPHTDSRDKNGNASVEEHPSQQHDQEREVA